MKKVDRGEFIVPGKDPNAAYEDKPLPIHCNVVISAPHIHSYCMDAAVENLKPGASVLDVGCGSGYLTATFYELTKKADGSAKVCGIEHMKELADFCVGNL